VVVVTCHRVASYSLRILYGRPSCFSVAKSILTRIDLRPSRESSMRQQRPRGTTTRNSVVSAALDVLDRHGYDGLTIRAIATLVGAPPMSLYTHFANKEELLDLMYQEVTRRLYVDSGNDTWQVEMLALAQNVRATLLAHTSWTHLIVRRAPPTPVPVRERLLSLMVQSGMSPSGALRGLSSVLASAIGLTLFELTFLEPDGSSRLTQRLDNLKDWLAAEDKGELEPTTRHAVTQGPPFCSKQTFDFTIATLIAGLAASQDTRAS
jgi:AcrR family transcriptional regulator